jgi:hypothetical protein
VATHCWCLLLHDNARSHTAHATVAEIKDLHFQCLPHPPYSTDLAPSDFHVFGAVKEELLEASSGLIKKFKRQCVTGCASNLRFFFSRAGTNVLSIMGTLLKNNTAVIAILINKTLI